MLQFIIALASLAAPSHAAVDARQMYRIIDSYGRVIRATTFSDPKRMAHTYEDNECYIGVYDRDQFFAKDASGLLKGRNLMCQVLRRRQGTQVSFIDGGCLGTQILPENAPESQFKPTLDECSKRLLESLMSGTWQKYVSAKAMAKKGWDQDKTDFVDMQVDPVSGKVRTKAGKKPGSLSDLRLRLVELGGAYDRFFGRPALEDLCTKTLWAYAGEKTDAREVFKKAPWWGNAQPAPAPQPQAPAPAPAPAQPEPQHDVVPLLR